MRTFVCICVCIHQFVKNVKHHLVQYFLSFILSNLFFCSFDQRHVETSYQYFSISLTFELNSYFFKSNLFYSLLIYFSFYYLMSNYPFFFIFMMLVSVYIIITTLENCWHYFVNMTMHIP